MENAQERKRVLEIIKEYSDGPSSLIEVLNMIQEEHGYIPLEIQRLVAEQMKVPFSRVYEVTTFYSRFSSEKKGRNEISVCLGTACHVMGAGAILDKIKEALKIAEGGTTPDGRYSIASKRCVGACALAPVVIVNKDVHSKMTLEKVPAMLAAYS